MRSNAFMLDSSREATIITKSIMTCVMQREESGSSDVGYIHPWRSDRVGDWQSIRHAGMQACRRTCMCALARPTGHSKIMHRGKQERCADVLPRDGAMDPWRDCFASSVVPISTHTPPYLVCSDRVWSTLSKHTGRAALAGVLK